MNNEFKFAHTGSQSHDAIFLTFKKTNPMMYFYIFILSYDKYYSNTVIRIHILKKISEKNDRNYCTVSKNGCFSASRADSLRLASTSKHWCNKSYTLKGKLSSFWGFGCFLSTSS